MSESGMTCFRLTMWTLCAITLQITGLVLFVLGFFPVRPALSGVSGPESYYSPLSGSVDNYNTTTMSSEELRFFYQELSQVPSSFDRMIFMVVDGLPAEFVLGKDGKTPPKDLMAAMPYTQSLLANGEAVGYHAKAAPPTVTMPRLKAMVSGAIGGFLDVVFNFNTQAFLDDNLLAQFFKIGWKMVMFGDETWLKLFPEFFIRQDGVSSFFVKDTVQVDNNVSRHLPYELNQDDWQLMILHYLGVDHVGHIGGRKSVLMVPKLKEMDDVIKLIHQSNILNRGSDKGRTLLVVASDHGMADNGNHGGSTYQETDSLMLFVGLNSRGSEHSAIISLVKQVDFTPTIALLFGVPIPVNNVGSLIPETLDSLTDDQYLRALELNSWQLLRLLGAQLPHLTCLKSAPNAHADSACPITSTCWEAGAIEKKLCCLYSTAAALHSCWKSKNLSGLDVDHYRNTTTAYYQFLRAASGWLARRVTDKPVGQLILGILAMFLSTVVFLRVLYCLRREELFEQMYDFTDLNRSIYSLSLDEKYILSAIMLLVASMGSSSMVEEEQYLWHYFMSTLCWILLHRNIKSLPFGVMSSVGNRQCTKRYSHIVSIIMVLLSVRIMKGWHQGGVNWTHLSDISKWLEQSGSSWVKAIQVLTVLLVIICGLFALNEAKLTGIFLLPVEVVFLVLGLLVLQHLVNFQNASISTSSYSATLMAQLIYAFLGVFAFVTVLASPWVASAFITRGSSIYNSSSSTETRCLLERFRASSYLSGLVCILCWSLLQLLLQQPVNSMLVFLLLIQIVAIVIYFSINELHSTQWVEVTTLYFIGMAGHFGLGNTNTLATIDVAGAFIGISSHSTVLSGVLMFSITYASPLMVLLSLVLYISNKCSRAPRNADFSHALKMIGTPCLVPLGLNSVLLTAYTFVLLLMRNHLFIWSVFSPKYMYVCVTTACVYIGLFMVALVEIYTFSTCALMSRGTGG